MRLRDVLGFLLGSLAVHAACSATNDDPTGVDAAVSDARADDAAPAKPTVDEVKCDKSYTAGTSTLWYAERAFPGRSKEDLARGVAIICGTATIPGYSCSTNPILVRDGAVAVGCRKDDIVEIVMPL